MRAAAVCGLVLALARAAPAEAQVIDGNAEVQGVVLAVGTLAGLTNSVATVVYAAQNRSFDHGWVISSFVSTAVCGAFAVGLTAEASDTGEGALVVSALVYYVLALWPGAWTLRGALSEVAPGERFDAAAPKPEALAAPPRDPFRRARSPRLPATALALPPIRF
jgi:hypothetical protein